METGKQLEKLAQLNLQQSQILSEGTERIATVQVQYKSERAAQFLKSIAKGPKMDFPCFSGENPLGWIRQVNKYFELTQAPDECKVNLAQTYIVGRADNWIRSAKLHNVDIPWEQFYRSICDRFAESSTYEVLEKFHSVR